MDNSLSLHEAFARGDVEAVRALLGNPADFPNGPGQDWLRNVLVYAIYWSPLEAVRTLLDLGADASYESNDGFPPLIAATDRRIHDGVDDRAAVIGLLLAHGADPNLRGMNDGTALHQVVWKRVGWPDHLEAARTLIAHGADPDLKTRIDDCRSPLEDAEAAGAEALAEVLRAARAKDA